MSAEFISDFSKNTRDTAMDGLLSFANFWGAGPAAEGLIRRIFGKKELPTSSEVESAITKIMSSAKAKSTADLVKMQNQLAEIPIVKSSLQQETVQKYFKQLKEKVAKVTANIGLADDLANVAMATASNLSLANPSERKYQAKEAEETAKRAAEMYSRAADLSQAETKI